MTTKTMKITKTRARPTPAPAPIATPEQPKATTSEDLATQCNRCSELIDSLEAQMGELEEQHAHHEQALEQMRAEQEIRHQSYDTLKTAIEVTQERVLGLKLSLAVTRGTPSETATQAMLEQHQRTLAEYKQELKELEELDVKRGESDAKSSARHEKAIAELETQYDSLESQRDELVKQHEQLTESLGWQIYREYEQATSKLQQKIEEVDAQRRGQEHAYRYAQAELRQEALNDLRPWPHVVWRIESLQRGIDAQRVDERHEKIPLVALLRAHQAFLRALQQHGRACAQRRYGNYDLAQVLSLSPQVVADALLKPIDFKPNIETDNSIIEQHT